MENKINQWMSNAREELNKQTITKIEYSPSGVPYTKEINVKGLFDEAEKRLKQELGLVKSEGLTKE